MLRKHMDLGKKVTRLRGPKGYAEVARAAQCSAPTIRDIESGKTMEPSVRIVLRLAGFFRVSLDWLADDSADWPPPAATFEDKAQKQFLAALERVGQRPPDDSQTAELVASFRQLDPTAQTQLIGIARGMALGRGEPTDADRRRYAKQASEELEADGERALAKRARAKDKRRKGAAG